MTWTLSSDRPAQSVSCSSVVIILISCHTVSSFCLPRRSPCCLYHAVVYTLSVTILLSQLSCVYVVVIAYCLQHSSVSLDIILRCPIIAVIYVTKSRTGNYDFRACARARGSPVVQGSVGHICFAVCAERSRDNNLRFLRKFHPDKIWNTLITITYLHR